MNDREDGLHAIVYVSAAVRLFTPPQLDALLKMASARNAAANVTGLLLHADGNFMQYIEGPQAALLPIYESIRRDRRHHQLIELLNQPAPEREFAEWAMATKSATMPEFLSLSNATWRDPKRADAQGLGAGKALMREIWARVRL